MVNDVRLPNMLHARMIRPTVAGAVPVKVDEASIKDIPGRQGGLDQGPPRRRRREGMERGQGRARPQGHLVGIEAELPRPRASCTSTSARRRSSSASIQRENGNVEEGLKQAVRVIEGEYEFPTQSHASMGPACAVADVRDGAGDDLDLDAEALRLRALRRGAARTCRAKRCGRSGCSAPARYGRNDQGDATADAAVLSQHLGRPVRVQYMRHEGLAWDPKGTASVNRSRAGLDAVGQGDRLREHQQGVLAHRHQHAREPRRRRARRPSAAACRSSPSNSFEIPVASYTFDHGRLGWEIVPPLMDRASPLRTTHLRDPYGPPILFGSESFMDEMAAATNTDPVEFRLRYLKNPRDRDAVRIAAESYGWDKRPSPRNDQKDARRRGRPRHRVPPPLLDLHRARSPRCACTGRPARSSSLRYVCAHDVGMIVNPETLKHVIDRQLVYGTSRAMFEEVRFDANMVTSVDWLTYPVLHIERSAAEDRDRADQAAGGGALGRGRDGARPRAGGDRQCGVRRDRRAAAPRAVHAGARESGTGAGVTG